MSIIPNVPPKLFSFSAVAVGYLLIDDLTANEQNALGNWLMLVAQVLSTNAYYKQVQAERNGDFSGVFNNAWGYNGSDDEDTILMLSKMIEALRVEIENIKKNM